MDMEKAFEIEKEARSHLADINVAISRGNSDIQRFYHGAVVLVTGGSGYMGKQLLEKLFRSCEIKKTYLLLRPKKGVSVEERLNQILRDHAFDSLHQNQTDFKLRIVPVEGDVAKMNLGMSDENWKDITESVTMVFHVAATVKFDEALKTAVRTNVRGTMEVVRLATECKLLKSLVYVSTAYSNVTQARQGSVIQEVFYPAPVAPQALIDIVESCPDERIRTITSKLTDGWPNTYTYTKSVAEDVIRTYGAGLPISIVRPAIVICAYKEPLPGWIDRRCVHGTSGIGLGCIMGILHVIICKGDVTINLIPVDYVNNVIMAAARAASARWHEGKKEIVIYNVTSERSFVWDDCVNNFNTILSKIPSPKIIGDCFAIKVARTYSYYTSIFLLHYIPATFVDVLCILVGKRPWLVQMYNRIHKLSQVTKYFTLNNWLFIDKNTQELYHNLSEIDKKIFNFDRTNLDVPKMMVLWAMGLRKYVVKDDLKGTGLGRRKQILFKMLNVGVFLIYLNIMFWFIKVFFELF